MTRAIYVRTSPSGKDDEEKNDGSAQLHELREWALRQGWAKSLVTSHTGWYEYIDLDQGGAKDSRPEWDRLRADVRRGAVKELVCTELSRLGRSVLNVVLALDELYSAGCRVVLLRQGLDYGTPVGRAVAAILAAVAQLERDQIRERIAAGLRRAKERGTRSGKPIGRPRADRRRLPEAAKELAQGASWPSVARTLGCSERTARRLLAGGKNLTE